VANRLAITARPTLITSLAHHAHKVDINIHLLRIASLELFQTIGHIAVSQCDESSMRDVRSRDEAGIADISKRLKSGLEGLGRGWLPETFHRPTGTS
ncbi:MAG: hypothetical protein J0J15_00985, partial [Mesorhizobium sp.]|nr:hypothetical protein [Mesorhizobium sp.]